jgi:hypothetical protein
MSRIRIKVQCWLRDGSKYRTRWGSVSVTADFVGSCITVNGDDNITGYLDSHSRPHSTTPRPWGIESSVFSVGPGHAITSRLERSAVSTATFAELGVVADGGGHTYLEDADSETRFNGVGGLHTACPGTIWCLLRSGVASSTQTWDADAS